MCLVFFPLSFTRCCSEVWKKILCVTIMFKLTEGTISGLPYPDLLVLTMRSVTEKLMNFKLCIFSLRLIIQVWNTKNDQLITQHLTISMRCSIVPFDLLKFHEEWIFVMTPYWPIEVLFLKVMEYYWSGFPAITTLLHQYFSFWHWSLV